MLKIILHVFIVCMYIYISIYMYLTVYRIQATHTDNRKELSTTLSERRTYMLPKNTEL